MTNIIVPGAQPPPTYPQTNVTPTPQGVVFTINLGPTLAITHFVSHADMEQIEAMRRDQLGKMKKQQRIANEVMRGKL